MNVAVFTHAVMVGRSAVFGPAENVVAFLREEGHGVTYVQHSLYGGAPSVIVRYEGETLVSHRTLTLGPAAVRYLAEVLFNARAIARSDYDLYVLVDPLNYFAAYLTRPLRRRKLFVFYTADYAAMRFANRGMNFVYHLLDRAARTDADAVWGVSRRIVEKRAEQSVPPERNVLVPNSPPFDESLIVPWECRAGESVVLAGTLDESVDVELLLASLDRLRRRRPTARTVLLGTGSLEASLRERVSDLGLSETVALLGFVPRDRALSIVGNAKVGLALYSDRIGWNEYRDSLKIREYFARGVPVVTTPGHPLAQEVETRAAGAVVSTPDEAAEAMERLLGDGRGAAANAVALAREFDRTPILRAATAAVLAHGQRKKR